jgi:hypothetical protein
MSALRRAFAAMALLSVLIAGGAKAAPPRPLWVYAQGSLPGVSATALPPVLTQAMRGLNLAGWTFVAGNPDASPAPDRVVWSIRMLPYAGNSLLRIGRLLTRQEDRFGHYRYVSVELRLYLGGAYQATAFSTGEIQGGTDDPKLTALAGELAIPLLRNAVDSDTPPPPPRPSKSR